MPAHLTAERLDRLRRADAIVRKLSHESGFDQTVWQFPVVLIPLGTPQRPDSVVLRPVDSVDGMTARAVRLPPTRRHAAVQELRWKWKAWPACSTISPTSRQLHRVRNEIPARPERVPMAFGKIGQTLSALEIFDLVRADLEKVEREIGLESVASVEAINYINQYLQAGGGKRLRPILVLLSGRMLGDVNPMLIRMAAVVEMIHTATLVHDDVIDLAKPGAAGRRSTWCGATIPRCWRATGSTCRPSRWPCASAISRRSTC